VVDSRFWKYLPYFYFSFSIPVKYTNLHSGNVSFLCSISSDSILLHSNLVHPSPFTSPSLSSSQAYHLSRISMAEWLTHLPAIRVMGSRLDLDKYSDFYFSESTRSLAQRDFKWSVWHCRKLLWPVMSAVITSKKLLSLPIWSAIISTGQSSTHAHTNTHELVASTWLCDHQGIPSAFKNRLHELHMARYQVLFAYLLTR